MTSVGPRVGTVGGVDPPAFADAGLLERAARGDVEAFDALLRPRLDRLFRIAVAILRSEADARDAVQEGCVHAWRALPRLREPVRFDAWLTQIVVNDCRSVLRRHRRSRAREIHFDNLPSVGNDPAAGGLLVADPATDDVAEVEAVRQAFGRLDPASRSLLVLHYVDGRPLREIGPLIGSPVGTVKWRLWRARRALARALDGERR
jgi:RNA polymerase sigma-70 factor (ECF subfamily)